jgi:hypothetical protein
MPDYENSQDTTITAVVTPAILVEWSRVRAWHGDVVSIAVRTSLVPDGTAVVVKVLTKTDNSEVDSIEGLSIAGSKVDHDYTIQWKEKGVTAKNQEFVLKAVITTEPKMESTLSPALVVDLATPVWSY